MRKIVALPIVYVLSRLVALVGRIGKTFNLSPLFDWLFDWLIGYDNANQMREEHANSLVNAVADREIEYRVSKQLLIKEAQKNHRDSVSQISRGESILSILIAVIAVFVEKLPARTDLPIGVSVPLPSLNQLLLALTLILVISVFFRQTAIENQAFPSPSVFETYDELMTKLAWNGGVLAETRVIYYLLVLQICREWDERFYRVYLRMIAEFASKEGLSKRGAIRLYWPEFYQIINDKYFSNFVKTSSDRGVKNNKYQND